MDDLLEWSDADFQKACKYGFSAAGGLIGGAFGAFASTTTAGAAAPVTIPGGMLYGAALGLGMGLLACPRLSKEKVRAFLMGQAIPKRDAAAVLSALGGISGVRDKELLLRMAAALRQAHVVSGGMTPMRDAGSPRAHAQVLAACLRG